MTTLLSSHSATQLSSMIRAGEVSRNELVSELIATITRDNPRLNAVTHLWPDRALKMAAEFKDTGQPFAGIPILLKGLGQPLKGGLTPAVRFCSRTTSLLRPTTSSNSF